jgi:trimeric autotransporter adhesin
MTYSKRLRSIAFHGSREEVLVMMCSCRFATRRFRLRTSGPTNLLIALLVALGVPAAASATVTSISQGQGITLTPNPITDTGTVSLTLPLALSNPFATPIFSLTNTGLGDAFDVTGPVGVRAAVNGGGQYAIVATGGNGGAGVYSSATAGNVTGVLGIGSGASPGVSGQGGSAQGDGGDFTATTGKGIFAAATGNDAIASNTLAGGRSGIYGTNSGSSGGYGGYFSSASGIGMHADSHGGDAIESWTTAGARSGIFARDLSSAGGFGGYFSSQNGTGVYARANPAKGPAGFFAGNVVITGSLSVSGTRIFAVDDPLDPANKVLAQAAVATPQAEDVYNGNIATDAHGYATVTLPEYFDAENTDPRYQLTVIGSFAEAVVWKQERHNQFEIRTNQGRIEVSWQVSAVRNDPAARPSAQGAEQEKPASERGRYLDPAAYGKPASMAISQP